MRRLRVLVVDDNEADYKLVELQLNSPAERSVEDLSFEVSWTSSLKATLLQLNGNCSPDVILLDLKLGDAEGLEGLKAIKGQCPEVPVVILSGIEDRKLALEGVKAGAEEFIFKGDASPKRLQHSLESTLARDEYIHGRTPADPNDLLARLKEYREARRRIPNPAADGRQRTNYEG